MHSPFFAGRRSGERYTPGTREGAKLQAAKIQMCGVILSVYIDAQKRHIPQVFSVKFEEFNSNPSLSLYPEAQSS